VSSSGSGGSGGWLSSRPPNQEFLPIVKNIFDLSSEALGQIRAWLEQNPPAIPITQVIGFRNDAVVPTGAVFPFGGAAAPTNYVLCDGTSYLRTAQAGLFAVLGSAFGAADGLHFSVPDLRGRFVAGLGTHTDVSTIGGSDGLAVGSRRPRHRHTVNESPHTHGITSHDVFNHAASSGGTGTAGGDRNLLNITGTGSNTTGLTVGPQTGAEPVDAPAYIVLNYVIKT
jgi:microcystin-dependent protein